MKYECLGYIDEKRETISESERNAIMDECFAYDDVPRNNGHFISGEALQSDRNAANLRFQNGKSLKRNRTSLSLTPIPPSTAVTRAYFRSMRAAEMAAWEMTGGDYVLSCFVTQA
jgi:hypothetical protein